MTDFLLELRSEEIPARMQDKAREDLARLFTAELDKAGLKAAGIVTYATPRRLALIAKGLPVETEAVSEETKGPKVGAPPQAMEGFLRKVGLTQDQLVERDGIYFAVVEKPGRKTAHVLAEAIPAIIRAFPWPKSQRWGAASGSTESLRWVRPLQGIVALLGDDVVDCEIDGIVSGSATKGHRFHHSGEVTIGNAGDYAMKLRAAHVIVDQEERRSIIRAGAEKAAADAGLVLVPDEGLVNENSGLTEWPVPMLGRFDPAFLAVPEEVIQLTARVNQKYFVCNSPLPPAGGVGGGPEAHQSHPGSPAASHPSRERAGRLANAFVCTANIVANDGGAAIVAGNEKVLAARLSDAKFFWEQDLKVPLDEQAKKLSQITFHEKLGTVADKVERVAKLARWLVEEGIVKSSPSHGEVAAHSADGGGVQSGTSAETSSPLHRASAVPLPARGEDLADDAERAARLCKADLVTGMVGEFPELQGIMGGYYARVQGEADAVADAVRDHYKPVGQGDDVPTAPVTVAVSLADKLDTIAGFFLLRQEPSGSRDPYALRRSANGIILVLTISDLRANLGVGFAQAIVGYLETLHNWTARNVPEVKQQTASLESWTRLRLLATAEGIFEGLPKQPVVDLSAIEAARDLFDALKFKTFQQMLERTGSMVKFVFERLKVQQREAGVRHDLIDAVFALGGEDDLVRLLARVKALQGFVGTDEGANLLAGYKRAANILKQAESSSPSTSDGEDDSA
ncbi:glycine--tRNA ligase subunit beta, partial [Sphingorhabdus sp.]|uniref:glycine--tRNA ligase subunit beta n=1 Tax=Sphingorhabdus sp. TaxID=1902408 RepID=UPI0032B840D2